MKLQKGQSAGAVDMSKIGRDQLVMICDKLVKYPNFVKDIHSILFSSQYAVAQDNGSSGVWTGNYTMLGKIDNEWMAKWLFNRLGQKGLTKEMLGDLENVDEDQVPCLFAYEIQLPLSTTCPKFESEGEASLAFKARADSVGCPSRVEKLIRDGGVTPRGLVFKNACFTIKWEGHQAKSITHTATGEKVEIPDAAAIDSTFDLLDNHLDSSARVKMRSGPRDDHLHKFFDDDAAFKKLIVHDKRAKIFLDIIANMRKSSNDVKEQQTKAIASEGALLEEARMAKRTARTEKARAAIEKKKTERGAKRRISLGSSGAAEASR